MKKIPTLFNRDEKTHLVYNEITPGTEWVIAGEGIATRKWDGTACMIRDGKLYKRYDAKQGRTPPPDFEPCQDPDPITGHWPGWVPVTDKPEDKWFREGLSHLFCTLNPVAPAQGTYELCGPKIGGNPEQLDIHVLIPHSTAVLADAPRDFEGLRAYFTTRNIEGIVWHHADGRMVKIKARDFGIKRGKRDDTSD